MHGGYAGLVPKGKLDRQIDRQTDSQRQRQRQRQTDTNTDTDRKRDKNTERDISMSVCLHLQNGAEDSCLAVTAQSSICPSEACPT